MNKEQILGIVRHILTFVGGFLITKGIVDETFVTEIVGALATIIGTVWSFLAKVPSVVAPVATPEETPVVAKKGK
jgi:flagellar motor component MotA